MEWSIFSVLPLLFPAHQNPPDKSLKPPVIFHQTTSPCSWTPGHHSAHPQHKLSLCRAGWEEKEQLYLLRLSMRINKPVFLHLFPTPVQTVLCFPLSEVGEGLKNKQTQNRRFTDISLNRLEQYKFCSPRQLGYIGKCLLLSYMVRNNRLKTHTRPVSIPQDVSESRVKLNWSYMEKNRNLSKIKFILFSSCIWRFWKRIHSINLYLFVCHYVYVIRAVTHEALILQRHLLYDKSQH